MSLTKRWLEDVSVDMGLDGEITEAVIEEAQARQAFLQDMAQDLDEEFASDCAMEWYEKGVKEA